MRPRHSSSPLRSPRRCRVPGNAMAIVARAASLRSCYGGLAAPGPMLGPACVAAYNAYAMCADLPKAAFLAMDARHCAGAEMAAMMAYAAAVGSAVAQREAGAVGFVGCAADATARFFGQARGLGTMPHALIGYAGSTVRAAEMFREVFPDEPMTVLIDYFGHEISDALAVARPFPDLAAPGRLAFRLDTPGGRYCEGLDPARSYEVIERHAP